jgi:hypothetical protein
MKSSVSRLHEIRTGNPATKPEMIQMAEDLINIHNSHTETHAWLITTTNGHTYTTTKYSVAVWEKNKKSQVVELTIK